MPDHEKRLRETVAADTAARKARDRAIRAAHKAGMSYRAIGEIAGMSHSRVQQIVNGP